MGDIYKMINRNKALAKNTYSFPPLGLNTSEKDADMDESNII